MSDSTTRPDDLPDEGVIGPHRGGYTVIPDADMDRILDRSREHRCPALLTLYALMSRKPPGWRFAADRLGHEIGLGRKAILPLLRHLEALGYYATRRIQDPDGRWRTLGVFSRDRETAGHTGVPSRDPGPTSPFAGVPSPESPHRPSGDRPSGEGTPQSVQRVNTERGGESPPGTPDPAPPEETEERNGEEPSDPYACVRHPDGPDHDQPCRTCGAWRLHLENARRETDRTPTPPPFRPLPKAGRSPMPAHVRAGLDELWRRRAEHVA